MEKCWNIIAPKNTCYMPKWHESSSYSISTLSSNEFVPLFESSFHSPNGKRKTHSLWNAFSSKIEEQRRMDKRNELDDFSPCSPRKVPQAKMTSWIVLWNNLTVMLFVNRKKEISESRHQMCSVQFAVAML